MKKEYCHKLTARYRAAPEGCVLSALAAWCFAAALLKILTVGVLGGFTALAPFAAGDFRLFALLFTLGLLLCLITRNLAERRGKTPPATALTRLLCGCFGGYCAITLPACPDPFYWLALCGLWALLLAFVWQKRGAKPFALTRKKSALLTGLFALAFVLAVGGTGTLRYLTFRAPNFDFGIFAQLFEGLRRTGLPVTTCERDRLLSHFAVHLSPILYALLPAYMAFPSPVTLQVAQAVILASAAVPMALLCRDRGFSPVKTALFTGIALFHPAVTGGTEYDFHENCFLLPLLLWLFLCAERKKYLPAGAVAAAVLAVKEDAAVYVAFFALFLLLDRRQPAPGAGLLALSLAWFLLSVKLLTRYGEGVMSSRYDNFIAADCGLWEAVQNVLRNPAYALTQLFAEADGGHEGKLRYALQLLVPLGFLPLCAKSPSRLLLLLPTALVNLLTLYRYQYEIGFQYSFGSVAFLLYLSVLNAAEMKPATARLAVSAAAAACLLFTWQHTLPRLAEHIAVYAANREAYAAMETALRAVPAEEAVARTTGLVAHLARHETLYETFYHDPAGEPVDRVIFDASTREEEIAPYAAAGYRLTETVTAGGRPLLLVYARGPKTQSPPPGS